MEVIISTLEVVGITAAMIGILSGVKIFCRKIVRESCKQDDTKENETDI